MNIRNLSKNANVERSLDRPARATKQPKDVLIPTTPRDEATISESSRAAAARVENLADRARNDGGNRQDVVAAALAKLQSGQLDSQDAFAGTAQKLLEGNFVSA